ncbi:hypothetical protein A2U01_0017455 [Trifolium medium]|uniref:Reverse transcriptase domain-containing protein n=1 Tax=Trifolium medium TaxID=97028 RepID=A0A392NB72_9FABA|nr:hypothetical protein [Trifolium medium]
MTLILADRTKVYPYGILEDVLVCVNDTIFPADFVVMDIEEDEEAPILLGRPFLTTEKALIDMETGEIKFMVDGNKVTFNVKDMLQQKKEIFEGLDEETNLSVRWLSKEDNFKFPQRYKSFEFDPNEKPKPLELKELPSHLKYIFLGEGETQPAIISKSLPPDDEA